MTFSKEKDQTERKLKETQGARMQLDQDKSNNDQTIGKEEDESYKQTMILQRGKEFDELNEHRYDRDKKQIEEFRDYKSNELKQIKEDREKAHAEYMAMAELQGLINDAAQFAKEIEEMHVEHTYLNIQIKELDDGCEELQTTKEKLDEQKKQTDEANEDLEKQLKAKEEANQKRLIAKLQRDRNPEIKELIQKEESQQELNEDFNQKFREEKEKHDELLAQLIELKETLARRKALMEDTTAKNQVQDEQIKEITTINDTKQKDVDERLKRVEEARKVNIFEDEKNRKLKKVNAAHKAKMQFIEEKYDYTSKAKSMALQDFKELIDSNVGVNTSIGPFTGKLEAVQKEIQSLEAMRQLD